MKRAVVDGDEAPKWAFLSDCELKEIEVLYPQIHTVGLSLKKAQARNDAKEFTRKLIYFSQRYTLVEEPTEAYNEYTDFDEEMGEWCAPPAEEEENTSTREPTVKELPRETAARVRLASREVNLILPLLGAYKNADGMYLNYEAPHECCWIEASPTMPWILKTMCLDTLRAVHQAGILKGLDSLSEILVTPQANIILHGFRNSEVVPEQENDGAAPKIILTTRSMERKMATEIELLSTMLEMDGSHPSTHDFIHDLKDEGKHLYRRRSAVQHARLFFVPGVGFSELSETLDSFGRHIEEKRGKQFKVALKRRHPDPEDDAPLPKRRTPPPPSGGENHRRRRVGAHGSGSASPRSLSPRLMATSYIASVEVEDDIAIIASQQVVVSNAVQQVNVVAGPSRLSPLLSPIVHVNEWQAHLEEAHSSPASSSSSQLSVDQPIAPAGPVVLPLPDASSSAAEAPFNCLATAVVASRRSEATLVERLLSPSPSTSGGPDTPADLPSSPAVGIVELPMALPSPNPETELPGMLTRGRKRKLEEETEASGSSPAPASPSPVPDATPRKRRKAAKKQAQPAASPAIPQSP